VISSIERRFAIKSCVETALDELRRVGIPAAGDEQFAERTGRNDAVSTECGLPLGNA
jgi:hypothetical protein